MITFLKSCILNLSMGLIVGALFAYIKLPIPAPPTIPAVLGIFGITIGYILINKYF